MARVPALFAIALALAAAPVPSAAVAAAPTKGPLSPRLAELAAKPSLRQAGPVRQAARLDLAAAGPGSLLRVGDRVLADVSFAHGAAAAVGRLRELGAEVVDASARYQTVTVAATPVELARMAKLTAVEGVTEDLTPLTFAAGECPSGLAVSEGDAQLRAAEARATFGLDGGGVTVGILSDSFDRDGSAATHASGDVAGGDLPGTGNPCGDASPVEVLDDSEAEGADEGRGMAQIVHDLAPASKLAFATAFTGETAFAGNVERLAEPVAAGGGGASVIADDVAYFDEPFFQDGPVAAAISKVSGEGVSYFSAAGNDNVLVGGRNIGSWQGQFDSSGGCPAGVPHYSAPDRFECTDFSGGGDTGFGITVKAGGSLTIDLQWAEPWYGVATDLDAYLLDPSDEVVAESEYDNPGSTKKPFELLSWENTGSTSKTVRLAIKRYSGSASPLMKFAMLKNGAKDVLGTEYEESSGSTVVGPTIFGHSGSADAASVAAVPYSSETQPEYYSSRGPVSHYFGPVSGISPALALPSTETLAKPDFAATDCGQTTFFAFKSAGIWRFCGTSAAAPHAAAVAALLRQADPALTPAQVREALAETARPVGAFSADAVGAGLLDATAALGSVAEPVEEPEGEPEESSEGGPEAGEEEAPPGEEEGTPAEAGETTPAPPAKAAPTGDLPAATVRAAASVPLPRTWLRHRPRRVAWTDRRARLVFVFGSDAEPARFACRVDRRRFRPCPRKLVRRFGRGRHVLRVFAHDAEGLRDPTPLVYRFRVRRVS